MTATLTMAVTATVTRTMTLIVLKENSNLLQRLPMRSLNSLVWKAIQNDHHNLSYQRVT